MSDPARRWAWTAVVAAAIFAAATALVSLAGIPPVEQQMYHAISQAFPDATPFRWITRLGSESVLFPVAVLLIVLLPREFFRHWWIWVAVMLTSSWLEGLGKGIIGRPRPESLRPGFPSGHTAAAAAFYVMAAYFIAAAVRRPWVKSLCYGVAAAVIAMVGLSRMVLRVHWPLDVLGGAALGLTVVAAAAWWHGRQAGDGSVRPMLLPEPVQQGIYRWQALIPIPFTAVFFLTPPLASEGSLLDAFFDVAGALCVGAGLLLRLWTVDHAGRLRLFPRPMPTALVTTGPYAHMRHPVPLAHLLIYVGIMLLAESGPGLLLIPTILILTYRVALPFEEAWLAARFGAEYTAYARRVPRFPRLTCGVLRGVLGVPSRHSLTTEAPIMTATLFVAALADISEAVPRLFPWGR